MVGQNTANFTVAGELDPRTRRPLFSLGEVRHDGGAFLSLSACTTSPARCLALALMPLSLSPSAHCLLERHSHCLQLGGRTSIRVVHGALRPLSDHHLVLQFYGLPLWRDVSCQLGEHAARSAIVSSRARFAMSAIGSQSSCRSCSAAPRSDGSGALLQYPARGAACRSEPIARSKKHTSHYRHTPPLGHLPQQMAWPLVFRN